MTVWDRLLRIDRRWIFLCIALAVLVPFLTNLKFRPGTPSPATQSLYEYIESLPPRSVVMLSFDYGPAAMPEMQPMAVALIRQCLGRHLRVLAMALNPQGTQMADDAFRAVAPGLKARYGTDYANLGFKPGYTAVIMAMGSSFLGTYPQDTRGTPVGALPVMKGIKNFDQVSLVHVLASSSSPDSWIAFAHQRFHVTVSLGITAVMATDYYPFLQSHQVVGMLNGMRGAAEYEVLVRRPDRGALGMSSQSVAHLVIMLFVLIGNVGYFAGRRARRSPGPNTPRSGAGQP
jgi:hypothetical protein